MEKKPVKEIPLTQGKVAIVDDEDFKSLNQFKWYAAWDGYNWYAVRTDRSNGKQMTIKMHREILNARKGEEVDHRSSNGLDNKKENLRKCTHSENMHNRKLPHKNNKSGIKGVRWNKDRKKFSSQISVNGKDIYLGYFNVMGDADSAYRQAEEKYFGEFARKE